MTAAESPRPAEGASWALGGGAGISARRVKQKAAVPSARLRLQEVGFAAHAQQEMEERGKRKPSAGAVVCRETREELPSGSLRSQSCVLSWNQLFALQHKDGYWPCTAELGSLLGVDLDFLANIFLKEKGILSLGLKAREEILQLLATLLVLQLLRFTGQTEGIQLTSLFQLEDTKQPRPARWGDVSRAVAWARSVTRRLLRLEPLERRSPLRPVLNRA
nr:PREDICTED: poly [ADP-ribose] polymerase 4-like [Lepisosteus oculatus]